MVPLISRSANSLLFGILVKIRILFRLKKDINAALPTVDYHNIEISDNTVTLKNPKTQIDLGGIAKGYIADQMKAQLRSDGITEGIINLGGNVLTVGPKKSGDTYKIGIQKPFDDSGSPIASVDITDASLCIFRGL